MVSGGKTTGQAPVTVFICVTCRGTDGDTKRPGRLLFDAVSAGLRECLSSNVTVTPVECLSVCKRPCTVALAAPGKWTYVVGDLDHHDHVEDVIATAVRYGTTGDGIIPWRERPQSFRKGVVSRIPPIGFAPDLA
jgi:predicted metal-binding protein